MCCQVLCICLGISLMRRTIRCFLNEMRTAMYRGEHVRKNRGISLKRLTSMLAAAALLVMGLNVTKASAATVALGSLGSLTAMTEEQERAASELIGDANNDELFLKEYATHSYKDEFNKTDLKIMTCIIYCEANGMGFNAKAAVGNVVLNRMRDTSKGGWLHVNTVKEVVYDNKWGVQFSPTKGNPSSMDKALKIYKSMDPELWKDWQIRAMNECKEVAKAVLAGYKAVPDEYMYFNANINSTKEKCLNNGWSFMIIDEHIYYSKNN